MIGKELTCLYGTGYKGLVRLKFTKGNRYILLLLMKQLFRLVTSISGCGFVLNQYTVPCLESISQKRETCLLLKNSLDRLYPNMENILYIQMEVHGMMKH